MSDAGVEDAVLDPTRETVLLALTRYPNAYGVPLWGFIPAFVGSGYAFVLLRGIGPIRYLLCAAAFAAVMYAMWRLQSWEQRWFHILWAWGETSARAWLAPSSWRWGGTTCEPLPTGLIRDRALLRDHVGA